MLLSPGCPDSGQDLNRSVRQARILGRPPVYLDRASSVPCGARPRAHVGRLSKEPDS